MSGSLIAHKDTRRVSEEDLCRIVAPEPTKTWHPISHSTFLGLVDRAISKAGLQSTKREFSVSVDGHRMFGVMCFKSGFSDMEMAVGLRHSTNKTLPAALCLGDHVFVCDNMAFAADIVLSRKHTSGILNDLSIMIDEAVAQFQPKFNIARRRYDSWKEAEVPLPYASDILLHAVEINALPLQGVLPTRNYFKEPPHPEYGRDTAWTLYSAATQYLTHDRRERAPEDRQRELLNLHRLFDSRFSPAELRCQDEDEADEATEVEVEEVRTEHAASDFDPMSI